MKKCIIGRVCIRYNTTNVPKSAKYRGYWESKENIQQFLSVVAKKLNFRTPEDWNTLTQNQIKLNGGSRLLNKYSMYEIKLLGCAEGKSIFLKPNQPSNFWENKANVQNFINKIQRKYNLKTSEDWNSITHKQIKLNGGRELLSKYSIYDLKSMACPDDNSILTKPSGYWENEENILKFLSEIQQKYNLNTPEDWNSITTTQIQSNGGRGILSKYSISELKCLACPEGKSIFSKVKLSKPPNYWENKENVQNFINKIQIKYNLKTPEDWNSLTQNQIKLNGGSRLLSKYSMNEIKLLGNPNGNYQEYTKINRKSQNKPLDYWKSKENQKKFLEELSCSLNYKIPDDLDKISDKNVRDFGGRQLLRQYSSWFELCKTLYPDYEWNIFVFSKKPRKFWDSKKNQKLFFSFVLKTLSLHSINELSKIDVKQIRELGGSSILGKYSSYHNVLTTLYPNYNWEFSKKPRGYWENIDHVKQFMEIVKKEFNIKNFEDWYRISYSQICNLGGEGLLKTYGSLYEILKLIFPDFNWVKNEIKKRDKKSTQWLLFLQISKLFPDVEVIEEYDHQEMTRFSGHPVQFDIFIPKLNLAFEYHGIHHYKDTTAFGPIEIYQMRDAEKEKLCKQFNIELVVIPYSWDNSIETLRNMIPAIKEYSAEAKKT